MTKHSSLGYEMRSQDASASAAVLQKAIFHSLDAVVPSKFLPASTNAEMRETIKSQHQIHIDLQVTASKSAIRFVRG
jgi:hypothetical protein